MKTDWDALDELARTVGRAKSPEEARVAFVDWAWRALSVRIVAITVDGRRVRLGRRPRLDERADCVRVRGIVRAAPRPVVIEYEGEEQPPDEDTVDALRVAASVLTLHEIALGPARPRGRPLPPRLREVVEYASLGRTNAEIACALGTTTHTVHNQIKRLLRRFGAKSRAELVRVAIESGLLDG